MLRRRMVPIAVAATLALATCARNPVTGKRELAFISEEQEIAMGRDAAKQVAASMGLVDDERIQQYVSRLGKKLADETERPKLPWSFAVVDDPTPNAFALPGGFIFVTRGLLDVMNSEAELAMVLGHEIGHVTARHSVSQISKAQVAQLGLGVGMILVPEVAQYGQLAGAGLQLLFLKFGRDDERQSDDLGFGYALEDGYDVRSGAQVFETLARVSEALGGGRVPSWLQTHPNPEDRLETLVKKAEASKVDFEKLTRNRDGYLAAVDGLVYGPDPRQGYFVKNAFVHPELRFGITFPADWQTQNQPQAVAAVSPDQDAAVILGLAKGSPEAAAREFASQEGVRVGSASGCNVDGACLAFQAKTQQGALAGVTAFIGYGGRTFQVIGMSAAERFDANAPALLRAIESFDEVRDQRLLEVEPAKIDVVRLDEDMTLGELARRHRSTVPEKELALINGLDEGARLERGQLVKVVVGGKLPGR